MRKAPAERRGLSHWRTRTKTMPPRPALEGRGPGGGSRLRSAIEQINRSGSAAGPVHTGRRSAWARTARPGRGPPRTWLYGAACQQADSRPGCPGRSSCPRGTAGR